MSKSITIMALDLGRQTGWSVLQNEVITLGTENFPLVRGESPGMLYLRFGGWLEKMYDIMMQQLGMVIYEQAHHRGGAATQVGVGLQTKVMEFCAKYEIECMTVHTATLKKFSTGNGAAGKETMIEAAKAKGQSPQNDDEADAFLMLEYAKYEIGIT
ncbi:MAG: hypothetical protein JRJ39_00395 [Deltaproteobacteria bacterium]|nr:hypothetical protein [Deltaproteobacteria bacterium]MBW1845567.1 hypothetical protein [Deltaproteobacteria bacterium]MBW2031997.1 hypothetical protein [Deltaproteobacteria bacterium]